MSSFAVVVICLTIAIALAAESGDSSCVFKDGEATLDLSAFAGGSDPMVLKYTDPISKYTYYYSPCQNALSGCDANHFEPHAMIMNATTNSEGGITDCSQLAIWDEGRTTAHWLYELEFWQFKYHHSLYADTDITVVLTWVCDASVDVRDTHVMHTHVFDQGTGHELSIASKLACADLMHHSQQQQQ